MYSDVSQGLAEEELQYCLRPLAWQRVPPSVRTDDDVELQLVDWVGPWVNLGPPTNLCLKKKMIEKKVVYY